MVALFGPANWWLPGWLATALRVSTPAAAEPEPAAVEAVAATR
jgi:hypothetical protein